MRYQISCIGKLSNIEENKIIQKYIKRVKNKIQIIEFPQSDIKKEGSKLLEYSPKTVSYTHLTLPTMIRV